MIKLAVVAGCLFALAGATDIGPRALAANPTTRVNLVSCANGGTRSVPAGNDALLTSGWVAATPALTLLGVLDTNLQIWVDGVALRHVTAHYAMLTEALPGQYAMLWSDDIGPITRPTVITISDSLYFPIIDDVFFEADGSPHVFSGLQFAGSCTLLPA